ncbi:hypothetical protein DS6A_61 [Mycobacterium phage DS6A]|uniref:Uncharacterized protein n=1 Tax=Mycobacterium phage DS6A TaxID=45764 RepID=G8I4H1_9CAUD|nr:hypothetical protein DS6A_61 [Mycobacterium phage DS6A]AER47615.1 hypothetical protein DS6A_61 [Mycobacterium phage DS6A]
MIRAAAERLCAGKLRKRAEAAERAAADWQALCLNLAERNMRLRQAIGGVTPPAAADAALLDAPRWLL